jgi:urease accessory protein
MKSKIKILIYLTAILMLPLEARAHLIGGNGILSGITHPLLGSDHLLAMLAVGIISVQMGGKALFGVPGTFVSFMLIGGVLALLGISLPMVEQGVALSVLVLGAMIAISKKFPMFLAVMSVGLFALFHGHSHGEEMPLMANPMLYAAGFVLSTTLLHIFGVLIGYCSLKNNLTIKLLRYSGVLMAAAGIFFLLGL